MTEGLREVPELLARPRVDLLGQQAEVVRAAGELVEERLRAVDLARLREAGDEPERAEDERALLAAQAVGVQALLVAVAQHEPVLGQLVGDPRRSSRASAGSVAGRKPTSGISSAAASSSSASKACAYAPRRSLQPRSQDRLADAVALRGPRVDPRVLAELGREAHRAVERHPAHDLRREMVLGLATHLPHAGVPVGPPARCGVGQVGDEALDLRVQVAEPLAFRCDRVQQLAVDVELRLVPGPVADPHGARVAPAAQVASSRSARSCAAVDPVHDLELGVDARPPADEVMKDTNSSASSEHDADVERLHREARVADPGVAVVPVALAALGLGQAGGRRGDDGAGGPVGQPLQDPRAEADEVAVAGPRRCRARPPRSASPRRHRRPAPRRRPARSPLAPDRRAPPSAG